MTFNMDNRELTRITHRIAEQIAPLLQQVGSQQSGDSVHTTRAHPDVGQDAMTGCTNSQRSGEKCGLNLILKISLFLSCFLPTLLHAQESPSSTGSSNQSSIRSVETHFNPRFAGPSARNVEPGHYSVQPFLILTDTYALYDNHRSPRSITDLFIANPILFYGLGITDWLDLTFILETFYYRQSGKDLHNIGDQQVQLGFQLLKETDKLPDIRFSITESFPTGKHHELSAELTPLAAPGSGAFETIPAINIAKIYRKKTPHPIKLRSTSACYFFSDVRVKGFNAYGGGFGTDGIVKHGIQLLFDNSAEIVLTQTKVLAFDVMYYYYFRSPFSGTPGFDRDGQVALVGSPSGDQLSGAVLLEHNPNAQWSFVGGIYASITGRNSSAFAGIVLTCSYSW